PAAMAAIGMDKALICPAAQGGEAAWAGDMEIAAAPDLIALINHLNG
ncbi:MAG TPA: magnesium chelatase subunit ChlI, partial [Rhodospirillaceae bacterium]|nr:magnesium chelatase subunit ChlI [Rhodospirillaceae bacterium]